MTIYLHDFTRPLAERAKSRKVCGPYQWTPAKPGNGRGFYTGADGQCARHGAGFRLRLEDANDHLAHSRLAYINGYYCDAFANGETDCDGGTLQPIIARLPHGRGFLAGWTMGENRASSIDAHIWETEREAAYAAHNMAERDAENSREASARDAAEFEADESE